MSAEFQVDHLDPGDDARLDALLAFAALHGHPRATTVAAYRELTRGDVAFQAFDVRDDAGGVRAVALATVTAAVGLDQVQLNAFLAADAQREFESLLDAVEAWAHARGATAMTAHVSDPSDRERAAFTAAGFEQVGLRERVIRPLAAADVELAPFPVAGVRIVSLADEPEYEQAAGALWNIAHEDVPSALGFSANDLPPLREELGLARDEPMPPLVLVAIDGQGDVIGLAVGVPRPADGAQRVGHRMTVTARAWRGRGVARALKVEQIRRAARAGVDALVASNDDANAPMRAINDRLGYQPDHRIVLMRRAVAAP